MYLMYADESGDCGMPSDGSPSRLFCLSGLVVHELRWRDTVAELLRFRHWLKQKYGVYLDAEIHAAAMINKPGKLDPSIGKLRKHERLAIIRHFADKIATLADVSIINVVVDKQGRVPTRARSSDGHGIRCSNDLRTRFATATFPAPRIPTNAESSSPTTRTAES